MPEEIPLRAVDVTDVMWDFFETIRRHRYKKWGAQVKCVLVVMSILRLRVVMGANDLS
jgi:hypothetical protein